MESTNELLQQMKIKNDALCTFCQTSNESIVHLFWQCNKTQQFIRSVTACLNTFGIHCDIYEKYFIFGWQEEQCFYKGSKLHHTLRKILYIFGKV